MRLIAGGEDALVAVAVDEGVRGVAVGADGGAFVDAEVVLQGLRRLHGHGAAADGLVEGAAHVVHFEGDVLHAVAVLDEPAGSRDGPADSGEASTKVMLPCRRT